jgi:hypothetical protein
MGFEGLWDLGVVGFKCGVVFWGIGGKKSPFTIILPNL